MPKNTADFAGVVVSGATYCHFPSHHGSTLLSFFVGSVSPLCIQIHRGRRPGVAPGPLRYRHSFRFTPLLAGLLVGTCGGIPGRTTSEIFKSQARLQPYIYIYMSQTAASLTTVHTFGIHLTGVFASMVFCKECQQKVEECPHFVAPIKAKRVEVFDEKVKS